jgi:hypothetical protein
MGIVAGAIVPHAPLLSLEHHSDRLRTSVETVRSAVGSIDLGDCEVLVIASPHGQQAGVYSGVSGSLNGFGVRTKSVSASSDPSLAEELARRWGHPVLEPPVDHGVTGALLLAGRLTDRPVIAAAFAATTGRGAPGEYHVVAKEAEVLAGAITLIAAGRRIGFLASAHTSAALSPAAPLLDRADGHALEERVRAALESDSGELARIEPEMWPAAGACGSGPLISFGALFAGRRADLLAYETPAGVGYLVALVDGR